MKFWSEVGRAPMPVPKDCYAGLWHSYMRGVLRQEMQELSGNC